MKKRYPAADILRGIGISLVILGHAIIYYPVNLHEIPLCEGIFLFVSSIHLPLLFCVAGFCFQFPVSYLEYVGKKCRSLMIPYVCFNFLDIVPRAFLTAFVNRPRDIGESVYKIVFEGGELWFIYALFLIFLVFPLFCKCMDHTGWRIFLLISAFFLHLTAYQMPKMFAISIVLQWIIYFYAGYLVRGHFEKMTSLLQTIWSGWRFQCSIWMCFLAWMVPFCCVMYADIKIPDLWNRAVILLSSLFGVLFVALLTVKFSSSRIFYPFSAFGRTSLQLYLLNGFLLVIARTFIISIMGVTNAFVIIAFNLFVTLFVSYFMITKIFARFPILRFISGMQINDKSGRKV